MKSTLFNGATWLRRQQVLTVKHPHKCVQQAFSLPHFWSYSFSLEAIPQYSKSFVFHLVFHNQRQNPLECGLFCSLFFRKPVMQFTIIPFTRKLKRPYYKGMWHILPCLWKAPLCVCIYVGCCCLCFVMQKF